MVNSTQHDMTRDAWRQARLGLAQAMHDTRAKSRLKAVDLVICFFLTHYGINNGFNMV